jgi:hypothetical protein
MERSLDLEVERYNVSQLARMVLLTTGSILPLLLEIADGKN